MHKLISHLNPSAQSRLHILSDRHFEIISQTKHYGSGNRVFEIQLKVPTLSSPSSILTLSLSTFPTLNPLPPFLATSQSLQHELEFELQRNVQLVAKGQDLEANIRQQE